MSASTSKLIVYTKAAPIALGPLALASHIAATTGAQGVVSIEFDEKADDAAVTCKLESGSSSCTTASAAIKSLAQAFAASGLCGHDKAESQQVDRFIALADEKFVKNADFMTISGVADDLDRHLTLRSFLVGYRPTAADFAVWGAAKGNTAFLGLLKRGLHGHLSRWFNFVDSSPAGQAAVQGVLSAQRNTIKSRTSNATFELGLEGAEKGKVVTRLPPEPSGYLHIGHAKAAILNQYFARMYEGTFIVRYDDTNPSKEKEEFQQAIIEDLALMGIVGDKVSYTSDFFDQIYKLAIEMIKRDKAYADDTLQERMREERMNGVPSARRDATVEESLAKFAEMTTGSEEGKRWCLRAKLSYDNPNKAMRDPVIYRCNVEPHHRTGTTWKVYPTYDFACPIVDSLEGVTHALRTNEYRDRNPQYWWMQKALDLRKVKIWDYGRINFVYTLLSKRKLKAMVEDQHLVEGWDDPRFPTVRGIRRRGLTIDALRQYMLAQGPSQANNSLEWDGIWSTNKRVIDPIAPRHTAILKENIVECHIVDEQDAPVTESSSSMPKHKKNPTVGQKTTHFARRAYIEQEDAQSFVQGEEVTFMDWGNVFVNKSNENKPIQSLDVKLHLQGDFKKTEKKITWLAITDSAPLVSVILKDYDYLITKAKIEDADNWLDYINPHTEFRYPAYADANVEQVKRGDIIQFERKGYYICDKVAVDASPMEFILIPDGKAAAVALKAKPASAVNGVARASAKATARVEPAANGLPELAPTDAIQQHVDSRGLSIPVKTKMYRVDSPTGVYQPITKTAMHSVPSFTS